MLFVRQVELIFVPFAKSEITNSALYRSSLAKSRETRHTAAGQKYTLAQRTPIILEAWHPSLDSIRTFLTRMSQVDQA